MQLQNLAQKEQLEEKIYYPCLDHKHSTQRYTSHIVRL